MGPVRIIISGGIGAGKSVVGRIFSERGFTVLDSDLAGHDLLVAGHPVATEVGARWPETLVEGRIDRGRLGKIVFDDPSQLQELEALIHPAIRRAIERWARGVGDRPAAVEVPVLADLVGEDWLRVVVDAPVESRRERLRRRGMSDYDIDARMAAQPSRAEWRAAADLLIDNGGALESLESQVDHLIGCLVGGSPGTDPVRTP